MEVCGKRIAYLLLHSCALGLGKLAISGWNGLCLRPSETTWNGRKVSYQPSLLECRWWRFAFGRRIRMDGNELVIIGKEKAIDPRNVDCRGRILPCSLLRSCFLLCACTLCSYTKPADKPIRWYNEFKQNLPSMVGVLDMHSSSHSFVVPGTYVVEWAILRSRHPTSLSSKRWSPKCRCACLKKNEHKIPSSIAYVQSVGFSTLSPAIHTGFASKTQKIFCFVWLSASKCSYFPYKRRAFCVPADA